MKTRNWTIRTTTRRILAALVCATILGGLATAPAMADEYGWRRHEYRHEHDRGWHRHHERYWHGPRPYYGYAPPPVIYAPQPRVIYAPPPVVYAAPPPPAFSVVIPIR